MSFRVTLCSAGSSTESSPQCGGCRAPGPGFVFNSPRLGTGGAQLQQCSPMGRHLNRLVFYLSRECLLSTVLLQQFSWSHSYSLAHYMGICQCNATSCWPLGPLGVNKNSIISNMSCSVHSQSCLMVKCCYLIFSVPTFPLPDSSTFI